MILIHIWNQFNFGRSDQPNFKTITQKLEATEKKQISNSDSASKKTQKRKTYFLYVIKIKNN